MKGLLLKYNKVHNDSLRHLSSKLSKYCEIIWGDLSSFGSSMNLLSSTQVKNYLDSFGQYDFVVIGDVFWDTGQHVCKVCQMSKVPVFFMQHGQWIYIANKKSLEYYPDYTLLFGDNVGKMCSEWTYANHSKICVVGSPRYDEAMSNGVGSYTYFSPPVIEEIIHNKPSGRVRKPFLQALENIAGIDSSIPLVIQPHYREARISILHKLFPKAQFADPDLDTLKLIRGSCQVLTSRNSTVVLDAIAHQKPVVLLDFPDTDVCFFKRGYFGDFAIENHSREELLKNLTSPKKFHKHAYSQRAKPYIYLGNASDRIVDLILSEV